MVTSSVSARPLPYQKDMNNRSDLPTSPEQLLASAARADRSKHVLSLFLAIQRDEIEQDLGGAESAIRFRFVRQQKFRLAVYSSRGEGRDMAGHRVMLNTPVRPQQRA